MLAAHALTSSCAFVGKRTLITGGSRRIGLVISERFGDEGVEVIIVSREQKQLDELAIKLSEGARFKSAAFEAFLRTQPDFGTKSTPDFTRILSIPLTAIGKTLSR